MTPTPGPVIQEGNGFSPMSWFKRLWMGGAAVEADRPRSEKLKWPYTTPIDKTDPYWEFNNNMSCNGTSYKKEEVSPGVWQWVVNEKAMAAKRERDAARRDLWWALQTRALTDDEMAEVRRYGGGLNVESNTPYSAQEKARELGDALERQARLRMLAASIPPPPEPSV